MRKHLKGKGWYVLRTGFRKEKYVQRLLQSKHITAYVPVIRRSKSYARKVKIYEVPLISCYVFVHLDESKYVEVLQTEYVLGFVNFGEQVTRVPDREVDLMKRIVGELDVERALPLGEIEEGRRVELLAGGLTGLKGTVIDKTNKVSCVVELETIGYALCIRVDVNQLRYVA